MSRASRSPSLRGAERHQALYACHLVRERDDEVIGRVAMDLSSGGMQVLTGSKVLTGEPVRVTFQVPETQRWLTLQGTVARVLHGRRPNEWGRRLGVAFHELTVSDVERLREADRMLEMPPMRGG